MGNSPSIPGLNGGRTHVRDDSSGGSQAGQRPVQQRIDTVETQILDESESEGTQNGDEHLVVPEPPIGYTTPSTAAQCSHTHQLAN